MKFPYSLDNKRYHTLNYHYKNLFGIKVCKLSLNGNFSCPNKDGKVGFGGCTYCSNLGSGDFAGNTYDSLEVQIQKLKQQMKKKWPDSKFIGYFQANTNTYAPLAILKEKYETVLKQEDIVGLSIATRSDAIDNNLIDYLEGLSKKTYLTIELGLQTIHEKTAKRVNRGHTLENFEATVKLLRKRNINVVVHIINGLPYETKEMMIDTVKYLASLDIQGIKIHMLHVLENTVLANEYKANPFPILSREEYVDITCCQLELLPKDIVIHRITGDPKEDDLVEPTWLKKKFCVLNEIDKELNRRNTYQGIRKESNIS